MPTPQSVLMTMLGRYCSTENPAIATAGYIELLERIGIGAQATRLTVSRMTDRGLLERLRAGRVAYFRATDVAMDVVRNQDRRTFRTPGRAPGPDGVWTILTFSLPESQRNERHLLRRRLAWEGFGLLRDGVWIAPGDHNLDAMLDELLRTDVHSHVEAFTATPKFADVHSMISRTWHLDELVDRYAQFLAAWDVPAPAPAATDDLGRDLLLITDWRQLLRATPQLPAEHLPADWPGDRCQQLFHTLHTRYQKQADRAFADILARHRREDPRS